jgi:hypothetical protein
VEQLGATSPSVHPGVVTGRPIGFSSSIQQPTAQPATGVVRPGKENLLTERVAAACAAACDATSEARAAWTTSTPRRIIQIGWTPGDGWMDTWNDQRYQSIGAATVAYAVYGDRLDEGRNKKVRKGARRRRRRPYDRPKFPSCQRSARGKKRTARGCATLDRSTIIFSSSPASNHLQNTDILIQLSRCLV